MNSALRCTAGSWKQLAGAQRQHRIWRERDEENGEWLGSIPDLRERKTEATKRQWRHSARPKEKIDRKRTRAPQKKANKEGHKEGLGSPGMAKKMELWEESTNKYREEKRILNVGLEEIERVKKRVRAALGSELDRECDYITA